MEMQPVRDFLLRGWRAFATYVAGRRLRVSDAGPMAVCVLLVGLILRARHGARFGLPDEFWIGAVTGGLVVLPGYLVERLLRRVRLLTPPTDEQSSLPHWPDVFLTWLSLGLIVFAGSAGVTRLLGGGLSDLIGLHTAVTALLAAAAIVVPVSAMGTSERVRWLLSGGEERKPSTALELSWCTRWAALVLIAATLLTAWGLLRVGSFTSEDALVHLAHVRDLLDADEMDVADPIYGGDVQDIRYSGSLFHPYLAMTARLSAVPYTMLWHSLAAMVLPLAVLAMWAFGTVLLRGNLAGILSALVFVAIHGIAGRVSHVDADLMFLAYPGGMALYFLTPLAWYHLWRWRTEGGWLRLILIAGLVWVLGGTHLFYALFFAGGAAIVLLLLVIWPHPDASLERFRSGIAIAAVLVPLVLVVAGRLHGLGDVTNPFFVESKERHPPSHHDVFVWEHATPADASSLWRLEWPLLLERQGIRLFPSKAPRASLWLCIPLLFLARRRSPAAIYMLTLTLTPILLNLSPSLLVFLQEKMSIHKVIRLGQMMPHAYVLGWALDCIAVGAAWVAMSLYKDSRIPGWASRVSASAFLAVMAVGYIGLDAVARHPLGLAVSHVEEANAYPSYAEHPCRIRTEGRDTFLGFFESAPYRPRSVLSHSEESLLLAAYTGQNVAGIARFHASPAAADAVDREKLAGQVLDGTLPLSELLVWLERYEVDLLTFYADERERAWIRPEGTELLDQAPFLERTDGPPGYATWRFVQPSVPSS